MQKLGWVGAALVAAWVAGCQRAPAEPAASQAVAAEVALPVTAVSVRAEPLPQVLEVVGQAEGAKEVQVRARVGGILERVLYREGEQVRAGAPMFQIEREPYEIALEQARARRQQVQAQVEQAQREVQRLAALVGQQAVAQREYDDAQSALQVAQAALAQAEAAVREAELNRSYTTVYAPISGVAGRALPSVGSLLVPSSDVGGWLTTIVQTDPLWVRFALSEQEATLLRQARQVRLQLVDAQGRVLLSDGRLNFKGVAVDPQLGTVPLRAEFANPQQAVWPGQFVRVRLELLGGAAYRVPQAAVVQSAQGRAVWVVRDGRAVVVPVTAGEWMGADWVIRSGLNDGDVVIVDNLMKLRPGASVQVRFAASSPTASPTSPAAAVDPEPGLAAGDAPRRP